MNTFHYQADTGTALLDDSINHRESDASQNQFHAAKGQSSASRKKSTESMGGSAGTSNAARASKKRTKTGCLTCRRRRIKCGEERPTCNNCVKSKRGCEGYTQRVVFKVGGFRSPSGDAIDGRMTMGMPGNAAAYDPNVAAAYAAATGSSRYPYTVPPARGAQLLQPIAPAPFPRHDDNQLHSQLPPHLRFHYAQQQQQQQQESYLSQEQIAQGQVLMSDQSDDQQYQNQFLEGVPPGQQERDANSPPLQQTQDRSYPISHSNSDTFLQSQQDPQPGPRPKVEPGTDSPPLPSSMDHISARSHSFTSQASTVSPYPLQGNNYGPENALVSPTSYESNIDPRLEAMASTSPYHGAQQPRGSYGEIETKLEGKVDETFQDPVTYGESLLNTGRSQQEYNGPSLDDDLGEPLYSPQTDLQPKREQGEYDERDDDDYDDEEDDDVPMDVMPRAAISSLLAPHILLTDQDRVSFRSFLPDAGVLTTYTPCASSSPLMNPTTARIFVHWVYVLGPSLSIFEREPPNPHAAFTPGSVLNGPQNVWSYTVPMLSLSNSLLLHALLALSSLHMAKLSKTALSPAHVHYHLAVRRLRKAINDNKQRSDVCTLAATLLLAYYETMAADVHKWSSHVHGAKNLLREIDFERVSRNIEVMEGDEMIDEEKPLSKLNTPGRSKKPLKTAYAEPDNESITRAKRRESRSGHKASYRKEFSRRDSETYTLQSDLFWWFLKMDMYQSILSGNSLTLNYAHWSQCPPRPRIGTLGATHGSSDYVMLLIGKIADFQVRDSARKREVEKHGPAPAILEMMKAKGNASSPPPGPPLHGKSRADSREQEISMNAMRGQNSPDAIQNSQPDILRRPSDLASATSPQVMSPGRMTQEELEIGAMEAEFEWIEIKKVLKSYQNSLKDEFQPLGPGIMPPPHEDSPFGDPIYYRTYSIACLQMLYKTAEIILERCHPSMPSNPMVAAGIIAHRTAGVANDIGRVIAGLVPPIDTTEISPALGAAMIELTIAAMFAGVQYRDAKQREWLVDNLLNVSRLTGWGTAERVASGCQHAWEKAALMGRGPPYNRPNPAPQGEEGTVNAETDSENGFVLQAADRSVYFAYGILGEPIETGFEDLL